MRVVIASRIFSPEPSAASIMLEAVARRFRDAGHQVTVLTTTPPRGIAATEIDGVTIARAPVRRDALGYVRGYLSYLSFDVPLAVRLLATRRADLYVVEPPPTTGAVTRVITALLRRPYVYDAADLWSDAAQMVTSSRLVIGLLRRVELFALRGAAHAFAISNGLVGRLGELGVRTPTTVIGFGVDTEAFNYRPAGEIPPSDVSVDVPADPYLIYPGSYSEWHGAGIFVEAFARLRAEQPDLRLLFVGNGADRPALERRCAELELDGVEFRDHRADLLHGLDDECGAVTREPQARSGLRLCVHHEDLLVSRCRLPRSLHRHGADDSVHRRDLARASGRQCCRLPPRRRR